MPTWKPEDLLKSAGATADWFVNSQITRTHLADHGRFKDHIRVKGDQEKKTYSTNWTTGMTVIALLMAWRRTRDTRYLETARRAGRYLKSLQIFDPRNPVILGGIREDTPQGDWFHPRDALSAAWGLLHLHIHDGDADALWRARLYADWFESHGMRDGYPAWTAYTDGREPYWQKGSFHGGSPLFFFDLHAVTGTRRWLRTGLRICDAWLKLFPKPDGSIAVEIDPDTGDDVTGVSDDPNHTGWQDMHKTNDDFTSLALLRAWKLTGKPKYLDGARRFLDWALTQQRADGAFGEVPVNSAQPVLILELLDLARLTRIRSYREAALQAVPHFLSLQEQASDNPRFSGGFYCVHGDYVHDARVELGVRTSCYALAALLRLEGKLRYQGYTA